MPFSHLRKQTVLIIILALSISVETSIHTATVFFFYEHPQNITHFDGTIKYLDGRYEYSYEGCSVSVTTSTWECVIKHIYEAVDFNVVARACNKEVCERPVVTQERTELRGLYS